VSFYGTSPCDYTPHEALFEEPSALLSGGDSFVVGY
jgi:hypothetical protein